jgi:hypothetical protein
MLICVRFVIAAGDAVGLAFDIAGLALGSALRSGAALDRAVGLDAGRALALAIALGRDEADGIGDPDAAADRSGRGDMFGLGDGAARARLGSPYGGGSLNGVSRRRSRVRA